MVVVDTAVVGGDLAVLLLQHPILQLLIFLDDVIYFGKDVFGEDGAFWLATRGGLVTNRHRSGRRTISHLHFCCWLCTVLLSLVSQRISSSNLLLNIGHLAASGQCRRFWIFADVMVVGSCSLLLGGHGTFILISSSAVRGLGLQLLE